MCAHPLPHPWKFSSVVEPRVFYIGVTATSESIFVVFGSSPFTSRTRARLLSVSFLDVSFYFLLPPLLFHFFFFSFVRFCYAVLRLPSRGSLAFADFNLLRSLPSHLRYLCRDVIFFHPPNPPVRLNSRTVGTVSQCFTNEDVNRTGRPRAFHAEQNPRRKGFVVFNCRV